VLLDKVKKSKARKKERSIGFHTQNPYVVCCRRNRNDVSEAVDLTRMAAALASAAG
jgi:hypothetical protein